MNEQSAPRFESWAKVELFGHNVIVGHCQEVSLAGTVMLRVDVPGPDRAVLCTRFFHGNAIYAINPISEEIARELAAQMDKAPVQPYDLPQLQQKIRESFVAREALPAGRANDEHVYHPEDEDDDTQF